jgi:WD40-like Beta Propeller Repeat
VRGYRGDIMEPFVAPGGATLFFNTRNGPGDRTGLRWAERNAGGTFVFRGPVAGTESDALTGVPSLDRAGELFFVSPRSYDRTLETIYVSRFHSGHARDVRPVAGLAAPRRGIVRFDADISADGRRLLFSEGTFDAAGGPHTAIMRLARRTADGFAIDTDSSRILDAVNGDGLDYAGTISADQRTLYFTRALPDAPPQIWVACRGDANEPFGAPVQIENLGPFVEAPSLDARACRLYFHRRLGDGHFGLFEMPLSAPGSRR